MSSAPGKLPFPSFEELSNAHLELCDEVEEEAGAATDGALMLSRMGELIERIAATGIILENASERRSAQSLLDYWATLMRERTGGTRHNATLCRFDPEQAPDLPDSLCPYVGLDSFGEKTAHFFFGRAELVQQLIDEMASHRLIVVVGPSGSGKS